MHRKSNKIINEKMNNINAPKQIIIIIHRQTNNNNSTAKNE